jgi:ABC-2 type transport system permease protein
MFGLMLKDFLVLKWYLCLSFLFGIWMVAVIRPQSNMPLAYFVAGWILIWFILARWIFAMDEHTRSEAVINSLPLSRREIVAGRHLTSLAFLAFGFLVMVVWYFILKLWVSHGVTIPWISAIVVGLTSVAFLTAGFFPLFFRLGYMRARWLYFFMMMLIFGFSQTISKGAPIPGWIDTLLRLPNTLKLGLAILLFTAVMQLSIWVCTRLYRTREF